MRNLAWIICLFIFNNSLANAFDNQTLQEMEQESNRQARDSARPTTNINITDRPKLSNSPQVTALPSPGGTCFHIHRTSLSGTAKGLPTPPFFQRLIGQCADSHAIAKLLDDMNLFYQNQGFITKRVSIPRQTLLGGILRLTITPGTVGTIRYADNTTADSRLRAAFPMKQGDLLVLRQLEQGLDNFNQAPSQSGKFQLVPGKVVGSSDIVVIATQDKRWRIAGSLDNSGYQTTGRVKPSIDLAFDSLLGSNDTLTLGYNTNSDQDNGRRLSHSANIQYSIPYQNWSFSIGRSKHEFKRAINGVNQDYQVNGDSTNTTLGMERLLKRNQTTRHYTYANLAIKESHNYIEDVEIETQKRHLAVFSSGWRGDKNLGGTKFDWRLGGKWGLSAFGAMDDVPGPAVSQFSALEAKANLKKPVHNNKLIYNSTLAAQISQQELPGSEQFGVGGRYDVRGFHEDSLFGNSGIYWRNELETPEKIHGSVKVKHYIGLDIGKVKNPATVSWTNPTIAGTAIGSRVVIGKHFNTELTYTRAINRPPEFTDNRNQLYLKATWNY